MIYTSRVSFQSLSGQHLQKNVATFVPFLVARVTLHYYSVIGIEIFKASIYH